MGHVKTMLTFSNSAPPCLDTGGYGPRATPDQRGWWSPRGPRSCHYARPKHEHPLRLVRLPQHSDEVTSYTSCESHWPRSMSSMSSMSYSLLPFPRLLSLIFSCQSTFEPTWKASAAVTQKPQPCSRNLHFFSLCLSHLSKHENRFFENIMWTRIRSRGSSSSSNDKRRQLMSHEFSTVNAIAGVPAVSVDVIVDGVVKVKASRKNKLWSAGMRNWLCFDSFTQLNESLKLWLRTSRSYVAQ